MKELIFYFLKVNILIIIFYLFWFFILKNTTYNKIIRLYFLFGIIFSFVLPILNFSFQKSNENSNYSYVLDSITVANNQVQEVVYNSLTAEKIILYIYLVSCLFFLVRFSIRLFAILKLTVKYKIINLSGNKIVKLNSNFSTFSFLNIIFVAQNNLMQKDYEKIIKHESIHIKQGHSFDNLFLEILTIMFWFNPIIYLYHKALKEVHEYLADEGVLEQGFDSAKYQLLLIEQSIGVQYNLANNFNKSLTLKRITMMNKKSNKVVKLRFLLVLPLISFMFLLFSCDRKKSDEEKTKTETTVADDNKVYDKADVMPEFPGGETAFNDFIIKNIVYPVKAKTEGFTGKVFVQFVVSKTGKITDVKVLQSDNEIFNQEAINVVTKMPDWKPGLVDNKPVNVSFTIPIVFQLKN